MVCRIKHINNSTGGDAHLLLLLLTTTSYDLASRRIIVDEVVGVFRIGTATDPKGTVVEGGRDCGGGLGSGDGGGGEGGGEGGGDDGGGDSGGDGGECEGGECEGGEGASGEGEGGKGEGFDDGRLCMQWEVSSGLIRAHQGSSGLIRAHQGSSGLIRGAIRVELTWMSEKKVSLLGGGSTVPVQAAPLADGRGLKVAEPSARSMAKTAAKPGAPITASEGVQAAAVPESRANCDAVVNVSMVLLAEK